MKEVRARYLRQRNPHFQSAGIVISCRLQAISNEMVDPFPEQVTLATLLEDRPFQKDQLIAKTRQLEVDADEFPQQILPVSRPFTLISMANVNTPGISKDLCESFSSDLWRHFITVVIGWRPKDDLHH